MHQITFVVLESSKCTTLTLCLIILATGASTFKNNMWTNTEKGWVAKNVGLPSCFLLRLQFGI